MVLKCLISELSIKVDQYALTAAVNLILLLLLNSTHPLSSLDSLLLRVVHQSPHVLKLLLQDTHSAVVLLL